MAKPASGTPLDTGNALYTSLAAAWGMLENTGTTSADSTGNGHTLTSVGSNGTAWGTSGGDVAITYTDDATSSPVTTPITLLGTSSWSIALRGHQTASDTNGMLLGDNTSTASFLWFNGGSEFRFRSDGSTDYQFTGVTSFTADANYLLVYDQPGAHLHLYKNGSEVGTGFGVGANDAKLIVNTLGNGYTSNTFALTGALVYVYVWQGRALTLTDAGTLNSNPYGFFGSSSSLAITPAAIPKNHAGNIVLSIVGTGTTFTGSTVFTPSGVVGVTKISQSITNGTHGTITVTTDATHTGTLTITESVTGSATGTTTIATATLAISPTSGATGTTPSLTMTGANTVWTQETAAGLFTVSGGTGASLATPSVSTDTSATDTLTVGSAAGTLTITDSSTGATATFTATAGTIAITAPVQYQWKRGGTGSVTFTVAGTYSGSPTIVQVSTDGGSTWNTLDASPSGGNYTGTTILASSETDYTISVRFSSDHSVTASVANIANIRTVLAYGGQSNESGRGTNSQIARSVFGSDAHRKKTTTSATTGYAVLADPTDPEIGAAGSYAIHEANILGAITGHRCGVINFALSGTTLLDWETIPNGGGGNYEALKAAINAVGGCDIVRMGPCETDAVNGTSQATYHSQMVTWAASWAADFPICKIVWRTLQHIDTGSATQPHQDNINNAILAAAGSTPGVAGGDIANVYLAEVRSIPAFPGDTFHWLTDQQLGDVGGIMAAVDYKALNPSSGAAGVMFSAGLDGGAN